MNNDTAAAALATAAQSLTNTLWAPEFDASYGSFATTHTHVGDWQVSVSERRAGAYEVRIWKGHDIKFNALCGARSIAEALRIALGWDDRTEGCAAAIGMAA